MINKYLVQPCISGSYDVNFNIITNHNTWIKIGTGDSYSIVKKISRWGFRLWLPSEVISFEKTIDSCILYLALLRFFVIWWLSKVVPFIRQVLEQFEGIREEKRAFLVGNKCRNSSLVPSGQVYQSPILKSRRVCHMRFQRVHRHIKPFR